MLIKNVGNYFISIPSNTDPAIILAVFAKTFCLQAQKGENLYTIFNMRKN